MTDPRPADPWKLARLLLLLGVMVAFLGAGIVGLVRGVPEYPYGGGHCETTKPDGSGGIILNWIRKSDLFHELELYNRAYWLTMHGPPPDDPDLSDL